MTVEVWEWDEPWPISLPQEPPRDRPLEARVGDILRARWDATGDDSGRWQRTFCHRHNEGEWDRWYMIVGRAMNYGWTLVSLPRDTEGGDSGN